MNTKNWLFLAILAVLAFQCTSESSKENKDAADQDTTQYKKADWSDRKALQMVISKDYTTKALERGTQILQFNDKTVGQVLCYIDLQPNDSTFQTSENNLVWSVRGITTDKDSLILDYNIVWDKNIQNEDGTKGAPALESVNVRRKAKNHFYVWRKTGQYWEKESPNTPKQVQ